MKKLFLAIIAISGLMYFLSCKKDLNECSTCNASFAPATLKLDGVALDFKNYATIKEKNWLVSEVDEKVSQRVLEILKLESDFDPTEKIYSIVAFSQNALQSDQSLNSQNYLGAIVYYTQNHKLYTKTITLGADKKIQADFSTMTDAVSINDYYNIGEILFKSAKSLVVLHNTANKTELMHSVSMLTNNIRKSSYNRLKIVGPDAYSYNACSACDGQGDRCQWTTASNGSSDYRCFKNCSIRFFEGYGDNNLQLAFDMGPVKTSLYGFRDNLLANSVKGASYIQKYEYVSEKVIYSNVDVPLSFCKKSLVFIHDEILPIVHKLSNNPQSTEVLYTESGRDRMLDYLESSKQYIIDPVSINIVDNLKNEVSLNCNKTVHEVYQYIHTP